MAVPSAPSNDTAEPATRVTAIAALTVAVIVVLLYRSAPGDTRVLPRAGQSFAASRIAPAANRIRVRPGNHPISTEFDRSAFARLVGPEAAALNRGDMAALARILDDRTDPLASVVLGVLYAEADGVPRDQIAAERLWLAAAAQSEASAARNLGVLYARGVLGVADPDRSRAWFARAAQAR